MLPFWTSYIRTNFYIFFLLQPHTLDAILVSQHLANVFVDSSRRSSHEFESLEQELEDLIYNVKLSFSLKDESMEASYDGPDTTYFLDDVSLQGIYVELFYS